MRAGTRDDVMDMGGPELYYFWRDTPHGHFRSNEGKLGPIIISVLLGGHHGIFHLLRSPEDQRYQAEPTSCWIQYGQIGGRVVVSWFVVRSTITWIP